MRPLLAVRPLNQSLTPNTSHANYEVTLVQADNQWHFQNNGNKGDSKDLYYAGNTAAGYSNRLNDASAPHAHWWDGSNSRLNFNSFSAPGPTMTFAVGEPPAILTQPEDQSVMAGQSATFNVTATGSGILRYQWRLNGTNLSSATASAYTRLQAQLEHAGGYSVVVTNPVGAVTSQVATLTVLAPATLEGVQVVNGQFQFSVAGPTGARYEVQATTNFVNWLPLETNACPFTFTNLDTGSFPWRAFRARYCP